MRSHQLIVRVILAGFWVGCLSQMGRAGALYVNSRIGNDAFDGRSASPVNERTGPVRTLQRAARLLVRGDALVLVDNGTPYFGSLSLVGSRHSGLRGDPLQIIGNGATISGARPVPPQAWREVGLDLWSITPLRKAYTQLSRGGETLPAYEFPGPPSTPADLPADHWFLERGRLFLKTHPVQNPRLVPIELASEEVGLTLLGVENVVIRDVTFRHFRLDGIHAHDRCQNIILDNVVCEANGRAGVAVGGTSRLLIRNSRLSDNRRHSLIVTELGQAEVVDSELIPEPLVVE